MQIYKSFVCNRGSFHPYAPLHVWSERFATHKQASPWSRTRAYPSCLSRKNVCDVLARVCIHSRCAWLVEVGIEEIDETAEKTEETQEDVAETEDKGNKQSRSEKKARKVCLISLIPRRPPSPVLCQTCLVPSRATPQLTFVVSQAMSKLGLKAIGGVNRVTIRKSKNVCRYFMNAPCSFFFFVYGCESHISLFFFLSLSLSRLCS